MRAPNLLAIRSTLFVALTTAALTTLTLVATPTRARAQATALDAEVLAQIDLFSAWLEGQIEIRGLPGAVVGVVSGDELVQRPGSSGTYQRCVLSCRHGCERVASGSSGA